LHSPNGIRAVLFDLDGTLRHSRPSPNHAFYDTAVELGASNSPSKRQRAIRWMHYYWAQSEEMLTDLQVFGELSDEFWAHFAYRALSAFDCPHEQAQALAPQVQRQMSELVWENWVPPDVPPTLEALKQRGFSMGVLSNRMTAFHDQLDEWGLGGYFECSLAAGEFSAWKPEPAIFRHALEQLGADPAHSLYVGDNYFADVVGARSAGLKPILVDPEGIFPEADCPVIHTVGELLTLLDQD
jgi:HAD superfamily hydrolase (TIGR01549 family)